MARLAVFKDGVPGSAFPFVTVHGLDEVIQMPCKP